MEVNKDKWYSVRIKKEESTDLSWEGTVVSTKVEEVLLGPDAYTYLKPGRVNAVFDSKSDIKQVAFMSRDKDMLEVFAYGLYCGLSSQKNYWLFLDSLDKNSDISDKGA